MFSVYVLAIFLTTGVFAIGAFLVARWFIVWWQRYWKMQEFVMRHFDDRLAELIQRNEQRPDGIDKEDINWLLMWMASYKGQAEGYKKSCSEWSARVQRGGIPADDD